MPKQLSTTFETDMANFMPKDLMIIFETLKLCLSK